MKKYILIVFLLSSLYAGADSKSSELLGKVRQKIATTSAYRINFSTKGFIGTLTVSGSRYSLIADEMEVYYDGETLWNYNKKNKEVNIENLSTIDDNIMVNPSKLLNITEADFAMRSLGVNSVELVPRNTKVPYNKIVIIVNLATNLPERVEITDRTSSETVTLRLTSFTPDVATTTQTFRFDPKAHKDVDVIDFR